jgi:Mg2+/Co2+ transporter CorB
LNIQLSNFNERDINGLKLNDLNNLSNKNKTNEIDNLNIEIIQLNNKLIQSVRLINDYKNEFEAKDKK